MSILEYLFERKNPGKVGSIYYIYYCFIRILSDKLLLYSST